MKNILVLISIFVFMACSEDSNDRALPTEQGQQEPEVEVPDTIVAAKSYNPSQWENYTRTFPSSVEIQVPAFAEVIQGFSGNHWAHLKMDLQGENVICIYRGSGSRSKTSAPCSGNNGLAYDFQYCISRQNYEDLSCQSNPFKSSCTAAANAILANDIVSTTYLELSVSNGDRCDTTRIQMSI